MMWKKALALLFGLMLISTGLAFGRVSAESSVTVILVSDNEADSALAQYLANLTGAVVITTPWGVYDPDVTAEIMGYAPDRVIVIGGPDAVLEQYVADMESLNVTVERWWGPTRYGTNVAVVGNATVKLKIKFENSVIVVPGNDMAAIKEALRRAVRVRGVIIFANNTTDPIKLMARLQITPRNLTIIRSPVMREMTEKLRERMRSHGHVIEVDVNVTPEMALEAINISKERITLAEEMLANITLPPQMERIAERMLDLAKRQLNISREAYEEGNYGKAYGQAIGAKAHAEFVIRIASREWRMKIRFDPAMRAKIFMNRVEVQLRILEQAGVNVTEIRELLDQLRTAIENGEYDVATYLMEKIRMELRNLYVREKLKFREHMIFPDHGRHRVP